MAAQSQGGVATLRLLRGIPETTAEASTPPCLDAGFGVGPTAPRHTHTHTHTHTQHTHTTHTHNTHTYTHTHASVGFGPTETDRCSEK